MIKYLEQLAELYWYRFSALLVFLLVFFVVLLLIFARSLMDALPPTAQHKY